MKINYPELGGPHQVTKWYRDGETLDHPSGSKYIHMGGKWMLVVDQRKKEPEK